MAVLLAVLEGDVLFRIQEQNLFLHTPLFFRQCMVTAGGLLMWMGAYLTQFLYYPMLGAGLLCLLWAFLMWLLGRTFHLPDQWMPITLVPVACLLIANVDLGYWIYYLKLRGYFFDATLGAIAAVGLTWAYRCLPKKAYLRTLFVPIATTIGYVLFGFYGLWAAILMGITAWRKDSRRMMDGLLAVASVIIVPLVYYHVLFHETNLVNIYWVGLPVFAFRQESFFAYNLPYIVLVVSIMLIGYSGKLLGYSKKLKVNPISYSLLIIPCVAVCWYKDDNFHREQSMYRSIEQSDWEQVLKTAKGAKGEPTRAMCMMQNLALFRLGRQGDEMFNYPNGAKRPNAPFPIRIVHTQGKMLYLQYGVVNYCYRWCMEDGVEYGWTAAGLKMMAKCALLNREPQAAQRFLNLLKKTDFNKDWAIQFQTHLQTPWQITKDKELGAIIPLLRKDNFLTADQSQIEMFLIEQILSTPGTTREQQELARLTMYYYKNNSFNLVEQ